MIHRIHKTKDYSVISNVHLRDVNLSLKTKGLLSLMLSLPDTWDYSRDGLASIVKEGKDTINSCLKELEENGYLVRTIVKKGGKFADVQYDIFETPYTEKPLTENPTTEKPTADLPTTEKPTQINTNKINTNKLSTNKSNTEIYKHPTPDEVRQYADENFLQVDADAFCDFYESKNWMVGKNKMTNWKAAVRNWARHDSNKAKANDPLAGIKAWAEMYGNDED